MSTNEINSSNSPSKIIKLNILPNIPSLEPLKSDFNITYDNVDSIVKPDKPVRPNKPQLQTSNRKLPEINAGSSSDSDIDVHEKIRQTKLVNKKAIAKAILAVYSSDSDDGIKKTKQLKKKKSSSSSDDESEKNKQTKKKKRLVKTKTKAKSKSKIVHEESEDEIEKIERLTKIKSSNKKKAKVESDESDDEIEQAKLANKKISRKIIDGESDDDKSLKKGATAYKNSSRKNKSSSDEETEGGSEDEDLKSKNSKKKPMKELSRDEIISQKKAELIREFHVNNNKDHPELTKNKAMALGIKCAVCYTRVSTDEQVKFGHSLDQQSEQCKTYCKQHNLHILKIYVDDGYSGATMERPQLKKMLSRLQRGCYIIVPSLTRLGRNSDHLSAIRRLIIDNGCILKLLDMDVDVKTTMGKAFMGIAGVMSNMERDQISDRVHNTMDNLSRNGALRTKPHFGWRRVDGELEPIPAEQKIIEFIGLLIQADPLITNAAIVREMTDAGFTIRDSTKIYATTIKNIILYNKLRPEQQ